MKNYTFKTAYMQASIAFCFKKIIKPAIGQALTRLVTVSSIHYCTSTSALSTSSSSRGFTSHEWENSSRGGLHA